MGGQAPLERAPAEQTHQHSEPRFSWPGAGVCLQTLFPELIKPNINKLEKTCVAMKEKPILGRLIASVCEVCWELSSECVCERPSVFGVSSSLIWAQGGSFLQKTPLLRGFCVCQSALMPSSGHCCEKLSHWPGMREIPANFL